MLISESIIKPKNKVMILKNQTLKNGQKVEVKVVETNPLKDAEWRRKKKKTPLHIITPL